MKKVYKSMGAYKINFNADNQIADACGIVNNQTKTRCIYSGWIDHCTNTSAGKYENFHYVDTMTCAIRDDNGKNQYYQ